MFEKIASLLLHHGAITTSAHSLNRLWLGDVQSSDVASECCEYNDVTGRTIFAIITWLLQSFSSPCLSFCRCWMWMLPRALVCWWDSKACQRFVEGVFFFTVFSEISILPEISPSFQNWTQFAKSNALLLTIVAILNVSTRRILKKCEREHLWNFVQGERDPSEILTGSAQLESVNDPGLNGGNPGMRH